MARRPIKTSKAKSGSKTKAKAKPKPKEPLLSGVSPQRRIDIFAIIFLLVGTLTLISLFTQTSGSLTGWWVKNLSLVMGWGVYILPLALIIIGAWMLFRNVEHLPRLSPERTVGITLFFINLTAWFHLIIDGGYPQAALGTGGGYIGSAIKLGLVRTLGEPGAIVALIALLLISLILTLDLVMANILKWFGALCKSLGQQIQGVVARMHTQLRTRREVRKQTTEAEAVPTPAVASPQQDLPAKRTAETAADMDRQYTDTLPAEPVWVLPDPHEILDPAVEPPDDAENDRHRARVIEETLRSFGAPAHVVEIHRGPTVTLFGVEPDFIASRNGKTRVRVSKITALSDDLALALAAARIRIQAPVPGKGYIGIEVPNRHIALVSLQEVMDSPAFNNMSSPLKIAMGKDVSGNPVAADLTAMPHLLIAGTTGAGKSVCINDILTCFLLNKTPDELRLVLVDPKRVELTGYNGIPHLLSPVIVDAEHVVGALQWMMREMDNRYRKFSETHTRNIADYNLRCEQTHEKKLPYLLVVIDELSDLMMLAPDETERAITRLAQLARATGIHLIIATQRPSTDILTGLIKANFPARIAFAVASSVDSRVILDHPGAERLLGRGDMLFQAPDAPAPIRIQSAYVSDAEINRLTAYWRSFTVSDHAPERPDQSAAFHSNRGVALKQVPLWEEVEDQDRDPKYEQALEVIREEGQASVSMLQRKMRIGYTRAARLIDKLQEKGIISEPDPKTQIRTILESGQDD
ncbi:MAG: DNA translocase FtsK [Brevefilum sp.]|nr:DNA translocase FtsK [Brevefilum sp.]